jgi:hypothetical protein
MEGSRNPDELWRQARSGTAAHGLRALGCFSAGRVSYPAYAGFALRENGDIETPVFQGADAVPAKKVPGFSDRALEVLGLELVKTDDPHGGICEDGNAGLLLYRAALLVKILDAAFAHLTGRQSSGQQTLQHQLVKACFTECFSLAERTRLEVKAHLAGLPGLDTQGRHDEISAATARAAKLMGGHGYLLGSLNSLETLSLILANLAAQPARLNKDRTARPHFPTLDAARKPARAAIAAA